MYAKILVPVDGSPTSDLGLAEAIALAKLSGGRLCLLHAVDMLSLSTTPEASMLASQRLFDLVREGGRDILARAKAAADAAGVAADTVLVDTLSARLCDLVEQEVQRSGAELIVIGTHGRRGVGRLVMGSDAELILRYASVPVLLVPTRRAPQPNAAAA